MTIMKKNRTRYYLHSIHKTYYSAFKTAWNCKKRHGGRYQIIPKHGEFEVWFTRLIRY